MLKDQNMTLPLIMQIGNNKLTFTLQKEFVDRIDQTKQKSKDSKQNDNKTK